jgi:hypothetical protein
VEVVIIVPFKEQKLFAGNVRLHKLSHTDGGQSLELLKQNGDWQAYGRVSRVQSPAEKPHESHFSQGRRTPPAKLDRACDFPVMRKMWLPESSQISSKQSQDR